MISVFKNLIKQNLQSNPMDLFESLSPNAIAQIKGTENFQSISGKVFFFNYLNGTLICYNIKNLPYSQDECASNFLATSINEILNNDIFDIENIKLHFSKNHCPHPAHSGDLPNLFSSNGYCFCANFIDKFKVDEIINKAIVIYKYPDTFSPNFMLSNNEIIAFGEILKN